MGLMRRFIQLNGALLAEALRLAADQIDAIVPGDPSYGIVLFDIEGVPMASITVPDTSDPLHARVTFLDAEGHETTADDVPQWSSDNEDAATVTASEDGLAAEVAIGGPGAAIIEVRSTQSDGSEVVAQGTVTVQPGEAVMGEVSFEAPAPPAA